MWACPTRTTHTLFNRTALPALAGDHRAPALHRDLFPCSRSPPLARSVGGAPPPPRPLRRSSSAPSFVGTHHSLRLLAGLGFAAAVLHAGHQDGVDAEDPLRPSSTSCCRSGSPSSRGRPTAGGPWTRRDLNAGHAAAGDSTSPSCHLRRSRSCHPQPASSIGALFLQKVAATDGSACMHLVASEPSTFICPHTENSVGPGSDPGAYCLFYLFLTYCQRDLGFLKILLAKPGCDVSLPLFIGHSTLKYKRLAILKDNVSPTFSKMVVTDCATIVSAVGTSIP